MKAIDVLNLSGSKVEEYTLNNELVEIKVESKEGFDVSSENNKYIILNTSLTKELINEGYAREIVSKVQQIRKNKDLDIVDRIDLYYNSDAEVKEAINAFKDYIMNETLSLNIIEKDNIEEKYDINGHEAYLEIKKHID